MTRDEGLIFFKIGYYFGLSAGWLNSENKENIPELQNNQLHYEAQQCDEIVNKYFDDFCGSNNVIIDDYKWDYK